jgi:hypothetical protein
MPAPASLIRAVKDALDVSNASYSESERCNQPDWHWQAAVTPTAIASPPAFPPPSGETSWSVVPEEEWFDTPTSRRPPVGYRLLRSAKALLGGRTPAEGQTAAKDLWTDPLVIGYLNIGLRRLEKSLHGLTLCSAPPARCAVSRRPGVARNKIGSLKLLLERGLGYEWFMITDISAPQKRQRSTGMAAVIHCSLARHITAVEIACPEGIDKEEWSQT